SPRRGTQYIEGGLVLRNFVLPAVFLAVTSIAPMSLTAQVRDTASLFGTVTDTQGAVVPGARVTITNAATGLTRSATSEDTGAFLFSLLPVGSYNLTVEQTGFRRVERQGIVLQANENIRADAVLEVGNVQETVTVEALATQVDTRSATLNHT